MCYQPSAMLIEKSPLALDSQTFLDLRSLLQEEFQRRKRRNTHYSLRAFARFLKVDPSLLCKVMTGKRPLTLSVYRQCATALDWPVSDVEAVLGPVTKRSDRYQVLSLDHFRLISEWYHYAIFELVKVRHSHPSPSWIAGMLGISKETAKDALSRLERLELIQVRQGKWRRLADGATTTNNTFTAPAFRRLQRQVLEMAQEAMEKIEIEKRDQSSMTFAVNQKDLPKAKKMIKQFRRRLCRELQKTENLDSVYHLGISFYPVTEEKKR